MYRVLQFRLKTFFIITTLLSVIAGVVILRYQYHLKSQMHYASFERMYRATSAFNTEVKAKLLTLPDVIAAIRGKSGTAAENYLVGGYSSSASLGPVIDGYDDFERKYRYQWPNEDGSYGDKNKVEIALYSLLNMESLEKHVVELEYADTKHNQEIAAWMEQELTRQFDITVTHHVIEAVIGIGWAIGLECYHSLAIGSHQITPLFGMPSNCCHPWSKCQTMSNNSALAINFWWNAGRSSFWFKMYTDCISFSSSNEKPRQINQLNSTAMWNLLFTEELSCVGFLPRRCCDCLKQQRGMLRSDLRCGSCRPSTSADLYFRRSACVARRVASILVSRSTRSHGTVPNTRWNHLVQGWTSDWQRYSVRTYQVPKIKTPGKKPGVFL